ncbi:MAG: N-acetylmuramoyl-L-alanine amidase [Alphaproteobacteria bacterium]|nr:N-acetylmuramoyl-L-alanine amidase [Alphaproteobacteria bacterium]
MAILRRYCAIQTIVCLVLSYAFAIMIACVLSTSSLAAEKKDATIRLGQHGDVTRFVMEIPEKIDYNIFAIPSPNRIVADISVSGDKFNIVKSAFTKGCVSAVRTGRSYKNKLRIVIDLASPVLVKKSFLLAPNGGFGWRFVVDLESTTQETFLERIEKAHDIISNPSGRKVVTNLGGVKVFLPPPPHKNVKVKKPIIVIDPGHGGRDPGTIGFNKTREKDITLALAKQLKARLDKTGLYKVYLTRTKDKTMTLGQRIKKAKKLKGDLFISIHADSSRKRNTKGLSVYTLSERASDREAAELAEKENKADILTGMDLGNEPPEVAGILIDLARRETMNQSARLASMLLKSLKKRITLLRNTHRFAGFAVLKSPTIPSVLVEVGYLSNKSEERLLRQPKHREKIARGVTTAVDTYFQ